MNWLKSVSAAPANISNDVRFVVVYHHRPFREKQP